MPIPNIAFHGPSASKAIVVDGTSDGVSFGNLTEVLAEADTSIKIFGKGPLRGHRRLGVLLARGKDTDEALAKVMRMREKLKVELN